MNHLCAYLKLNVGYLMEFVEYYNAVDVVVYYYSYSVVVSVLVRVNVVLAAGWYENEGRWEKWGSKHFLSHTFVSSANVLCKPLRRTAFINDSA